MRGSGDVRPRPGAAALARRAGPGQSAFRRTDQPCRTGSSQPDLWRFAFPCRQEGYARAMAGDAGDGFSGRTLQQGVFDRRSRRPVRALAQLFQQGLQGELRAHAVQVADRIPDCAGQGVSASGHPPCRNRDPLRICRPEPHDPGVHQPDGGNAGALQEKEPLRRGGGRSQ
ncbi:hypothetical protein D9M70_578360 [compost metagenome]